MASDYAYETEGELRFCSDVLLRQGELHYRTDTEVARQRVQWRSCTLDAQVASLGPYIDGALQAAGASGAAFRASLRMLRWVLGRFNPDIDLPDAPAKLLSSQRIANGVAKLAYAKQRERRASDYALHWPRPASWEGIDERSDAVFAHLRVAGMHPLTLRRPHDVADVLACADRAAVEQIVGTSIDAALDRLFIIPPDAYAHARRWQAERLTGIEPEHPHRPRFLRFPTGVFEASRGALRPVALRFGPTHRTITPLDDNAWQRAKLHANAADAVFQTYVRHIPQTHFIMESITVATRIVFGFSPGPRDRSADHPIARLLEPHLEGTVAVNATARGTLLRHSSPFCEFIAPDVHSVVELATSAFCERASDFRTAWSAELVQSSSSFHSPFATDFARLADVLRRWVEGWVAAHYATDDDVRADRVLQRWAALLRSKDHGGGNLPGFPPPSSLDQLVTGLATIVQLATIQHGAFHFPQTDIGRSAWLSPFYAAEVEPGIAPPALEAAITALDTLPELHPLAWQSFVLGQSDVRWRTLPCLLDHPALASAAGRPHAEQLRNDLLAVEAEITARNAKLRALGLPPYEYLLPSKVPCSINV